MQHTVDSNKAVENCQKGINTTQFYTQPFTAREIINHVYTGMCVLKSSKAYK